MRRSPAQRHEGAQRRQGSAKKRRSPKPLKFPTGNTIDRPTMQVQQSRKNKSAGPQTQSKGAPSPAGGRTAGVAGAPTHGPERAAVDQAANWPHQRAHRRAFRALSSRTLTREGVPLPAQGKRKTAQGARTQQRRQPTRADDPTACRLGVATADADADRRLARGAAANPTGPEGRR